MVCYGRVCVCTIIKSPPFPALLGSSSSLLNPHFAIRESTNQNRTKAQRVAQLEGCNKKQRPQKNSFTALSICQTKLFWRCRNYLWLRIVFSAHYYLRSRFERKESLNVGSDLFCILYLWVPLMNHEHVIAKCAKSYFLSYLLVWLFEKKYFFQLFIQLFVHPF